MSADDCRAAPRGDASDLDDSGLAADSDAVAAAATDSSDKEEEENDADCDADRDANENKDEDEDADGGEVTPAADHSAANSLCAPSICSSCSSRTAATKSAAIARRPAGCSDRWKRLRKVESSIEPGTGSRALRPPPPAVFVWLTGAGDAGCAVAPRRT